MFMAPFARRRAARPPAGFLVIVVPALTRIGWLEAARRAGAVRIVFPYDLLLGLEPLREVKLTSRVGFAVSEAPVGYLTLASVLAVIVQALYVVHRWLLLPDVGPP